MKTLCIFLDLLVGMSSGMLGLENSNPGRKWQFVVLDLQFFGFEKGPGPNAPSSPPRIAVFVED